MTPNGVDFSFLSFHEIVMPDQYMTCNDIEEE